MPTKLDDARETLAILEDVERFLIEEVGGGGKLTLANISRWAEDIVDCREKIEAQKAGITEIESRR